MKRALLFLVLLGCDDGGAMAPVEQAEPRPPVVTPPSSNPNFSGSISGGGNVGPEGPANSGPGNEAVRPADAGADR